MQVYGLLRIQLHRHLVDGTVMYVWFGQVYGLLRVQLHTHLVDGTVKSVWFRKVFGLLGIQLKQVSLCMGFSHKILKNILTSIWHVYFSIDTILQT